jgi:hypothetical protein
MGKWAAPHFKRLVAGFPPRRAARVQTRVKSCVICGRQIGAGAGFLRNTSVSPVNLHSTNFSTITITYHLGLVK